MAPPILKMETKMGGLRKGEKEEDDEGQRQKNNAKKVKYYTYHAMGNVTNSDSSCIKLNPIDLAPSDSSK